MPLPLTRHIPNPVADSIQASLPLDCKKLRVTIYVFLATMFDRFVFIALNDLNGLISIFLLGTVDVPSLLRFLFLLYWP